MPWGFNGLKYHLACIALVDKTITSTKTVLRNVVK